MLVNSGEISHGWRGESGKREVVLYKDAEKSTEEVCDQWINAKEMCQWMSECELWVLAKRIILIRATRDRQLWRDIIDYVSCFDFCRVESKRWSLGELSFHWQHFY